MICNLEINVIFVLNGFYFFFDLCILFVLSYYDGLNYLDV